MNGILYLEDGTVFYGKAFGKQGTAIGEVVFNTSMTGYQEILTDPSYAGQIVNMTYPLIGNYGTSSSFNQSKKIYAKGFVVKELCGKGSNYTNEEELNEFLKKMDTIALSGIDTRALTRKIRSCGAMKCIITSEELTIEEMESIIKNTEFGIEQVKEVSRTEIEHIKGSGPRVAVLDFGIKNNILENLKNLGCDLTIFPYDSTYEQIMKINPQGVFLSNGPGDPTSIPEVVEIVKKLVKVKPTFGICLGHQILSLAFGGKTYKLKFGHRGGNHGVYDIERDRAYITSQNHGYAVDPASLEGKDVVVTHINLNDNTVEGMKHETLPVFSVQFHPEGAPGPEDSAYLFDKFMDLMDNAVDAKAI
ncbi:glutamine-hydrolyzing carbamoyl-phosphate synthase small subunit [Clostridium cellulovorans]|uniref:Carbamoyl phosphate synthase small chain n=1 Tax=Clostridium cellulovorans (strain ATCC 35296 / DSM 3052 / OCM 3 / 743B) TaxID=573061 RepID=D9SWU9_CLOC7|nr:glutamine-hydrolyzing carbamoyl-phosphate synthase small subunit [Clostridium cellulovorans]ADL51310.1 carbamoyl-phosphate synthase, small subunit [Clostridium cellulovorans 743B]